MEVCNSVQKAVTKIIPKKKKCKNAKWLSEEALQIVEERRDMKGKGESESYTQLNAEFQRIARRGKKAFLSLLVYLWNSAFSWVYLSLSHFPFSSLLSSAICKASSDNHFAFLHFFFFGMVFHCLLYTVANLHP